MNRLLYLVQVFLTQMWQFMKLPFPATDVPIGALLILPTFVGISIKFIRNFLGVGGASTVQSVVPHKDKK